MAKKVKIQHAGGTIYPMTVTDMVFHPQEGSEALKQSDINAELMAGKIYKDGEWQENAATTTTLGGIKAANVREIHNFQTVSGGTDTIGDRYYGVEVDKDGKAFVHVPWIRYALGTAAHDILGGVMTGDNTGIKVEKQVIKADFDTTDYSKVEDISAYDFSETKAKVASPYVVNEILKKAIYDVLTTPI